MPSFIPGYEYDIFVSYRQKDNKYDGWVTWFVEAILTHLFKVGELKVISSTSSKRYKNTDLSIKAITEPSSG